MFSSSAEPLTESEICNPAICSLSTGTLRVNRMEEPMIYDAKLG